MEDEDRATVDKCTSSSSSDFSLFGSEQSLTFPCPLTFAQCSHRRWREEARSTSPSNGLCIIIDRDRRRRPHFLPIAHLLISPSAGLARPTDDQLPRSLSFSFTQAANRNPSSTSTRDSHDVPSRHEDQLPLVPRPYDLLPSAFPSLARRLSKRLSFPPPQCARCRFFSSPQIDGPPSNPIPSHPFPSIPIPFSLNSSFHTSGLEHSTRIFFTYIDGLSPLRSFSDLL
jgi:hypothetical protein